MNADRNSTSPPELHLALSTLSSRQREIYLARHQDPMTGPQTGKWSILSSGSSWELRSSLQLNLTFDRSSSIDWQHLGDVEPQSEALWKYSLGYLPSLLLASEDMLLVETTIATLETYITSDEWSSRATWMTSYDHAVSIRIRAICTLAVMYQDRGWRLPDAAMRLILSDVERCFEDAARFFKVNNHGAMTALAVVHASSVFSGLPADSCPMALAHLKRILSEIFDSKGIPAENSPAYHVYWLRLMQPLIEFTETFGVEATDLTDLDALLELSETALSHFVDHTGHVLPIGDSHAGPGIVAPARDVTMVSEESGFATYSHGKTLLTFNCGHRRYAHKHCDDTSITWAHDGHPIFVDSGFYGHNWKDTKVVHFKSQSAHSGLFFEDLDDLHPGKLYTPGRERVHGRLTAVDEEDSHFRGTLTVTDGRMLVREVSVESETRFRMIDTAHAPAEDRAVQRFILPAQFHIDVGHDFIRGSDGNITFFMTFDPAGLREAPKVFRGSEDPRRGWISPRPRVLEPAVCVELPVLPNRQQTLHIQVES